MTHPRPQPEPPPRDATDRRPVNPGKGTDGVTPDDSAPPQKPDDDGGPES